MTDERVRFAAGAFRPDGLSMASAGASILLHLGVLGCLAFLVPPLGEDDVEEHVALMQRLLTASGDANDPSPLEPPDDSRSDPRGHRSQPGGLPLVDAKLTLAMGNPRARVTLDRYAIAGPLDNPAPQLVREASVQGARAFGLIGLLAGAASRGPAVAWGRMDPVGTDVDDANGKLWGDAIGDSFGYGGPALSGTGEGGGGRGEGIAGGIETTAGRADLARGTGLGSGFGCGCSADLMGGYHHARPPRIRMTPDEGMVGRLPPETIQRIVRDSFGRFRGCYEEGLRENPSLTGRVTVKFVIDRAGAVSMAADAGSDLPDAGVVSCVVRGFGGLSFPEPTGGIVTVIYPIVFTKE